MGHSGSSTPDPPISAGKSFCFTDTLPLPRKTYEDLVIKHGGTVLSRHCPHCAIPVNPLPTSIEGDCGMASHGTTEYSTAEGNDYVEHERTYEMFLTMTKWTVISLAILLILMAYFLT